MFHPFPYILIDLPQDSKDDFDVIADYVFQASKNGRRKPRSIFNPPVLEFRCRVGAPPSSGYRTAARGAARRHQQWQRLNFLQTGRNADLATQLLGKRPQITVDGNRGLFSLSAGHPEAYFQVSRNDSAPGRFFNRNSL